MKLMTNNQKAYTITHKQNSVESKKKARVFLKYHIWHDKS